MNWTLEPAWWPYLFIVLAASLPTMIWRWLAVALAADIDEQSELLVFVRCISTALVAAVVAQLIFLPNGALAEAPLVLRAGAALTGFIAFLFSKTLLLGILVGEALLITGYVLL